MLIPYPGGSVSGSDLALNQLEKMLAQDPLLKDLLSGATPRRRKAGRYQPPADVVELDGKYLVILDVPGIPRSGLDVELDGARLVVRGRRTIPPHEGGRVRSAERGQGGFERVFLLPSQARGDLVEAQLDHGVLTVTIPLDGGGAARRVEIRESA
jgi:HSP20 family protein